MSALFVGIGAGPGMGAATAARFAREGFDVVLAARQTSKLEQFAEKIRKETGRSVESVSLDASDSRAIQQLSDRLREGVSVLHYNAAICDTRR